MKSLLEPEIIPAMETNEFPPAPEANPWWTDGFTMEDETANISEAVLVGPDKYSVTIHNKTTGATTRLVGDLEYVKQTLAKWEDGK